LKKTLNIYVIFLVAFIIVGCSTKKDTFLNRNFQSLNTKFNVLYNGDIAFQKGLEELNSKYKDDYWKRLPIEPLKVEELALPGMEGENDNSNASFEKAEEKAVKAVQKRSMNINGKERNQQIDNAYLLLGKSRYYSQRFVPALEAFNYVLQKYPTADLIHETRIWQAKTHLRLKNEDQAYTSLKYLLKKSALLDEVNSERAHTAMAMILTEMDSTDQVVHHLKKAVLTDNDKEQKARNLFILGQIYRERNHIDSSQIAFQQIIEMKKIPYKYRIHSHIEKAKNVTDDTDKSILIETLEKLIKDRENRPYLDELHYQTGIVETKLERIDAAKEHFVKSVHAKDAKEFQKGLSYEELGNIYFDRAEFVSAGAYYDSVIDLSKLDNSKRIRRLKRKRTNLDEVISFEQIRHKTDSVLNLVAMTSEEQETFFQEYIDKLKAADEKAVLQETNSGFGAFSDSQIAGNGKWYFYNTQVVGFGAQEFQRVWGNRPLADNWRLSDKTIVRNEEIEEENEEDIIEESKKYDLESYISRIPTDENVIDSLKTLRNDSYYNLGLAYKEQFKENELAASRFEDLLIFSPADKLILPTKYHLFKIYSEIDALKADKYKNEITSNYSDSKYSKLILNPQLVILAADDENSPEKIYEEVYCRFEEEKYQEVITESENAIKTYEDLPILPKFELLRAYAIGKKSGVQAFKTALEFVKLNYANTEEGKKAAEVIETIGKFKD
jgi:hypothetical protein